MNPILELRGVGKDYEPNGKDWPACGPDLKSKQSNRSTPVFPASRRTEADDPPEVVLAGPGLNRRTSLPGSIFRSAKNRAYQTKFSPIVSRSSWK